MFMSYLHNALLFSIQSVFGIYISIVLFRFMLQIARANFYNPISQAIIKVTNPLLVPLRKVIPGFAGIDCAALVLMILLKALELRLIMFVQGFTVPPSLVSISGLFIWSAAELIDLSLIILLYGVIIRVICSWLQPRKAAPALDLIVNLTEPLFAPVNRFMPTLGGLDFSPIIVMFFIVQVRILITDYFIPFGKSII